MSKPVSGCGHCGRPLYSDEIRVQRCSICVSEGHRRIAFLLDIEDSYELLARYVAWRLSRPTKAFA